MPESADSRIAALQAELAQLRADMQEFTATVSHDLRAPLRHIVPYVQLVEEDAGPLLTAEVREFLATITHASRQMGKQLDGLTLLSRAGSAALVVAPVALQEPVLAARDAVSVKYRDRAVEWRIEGRPAHGAGGCRNAAAGTGAGAGQRTQVFNRQNTRRDPYQCGFVVR
jgi:light-regulated signal transduction histidine kinase (bacteriophytochrome)